MFPVRSKRQRSVFLVKFSWRESGSKEKETKGNEERNLDTIGLSDFGQPWASSLPLTQFDYISQNIILIAKNSFYWFLFIYNQKTPSHFDKANRNSEAQYNISLTREWLNRLKSTQIYFWSLAPVFLMNSYFTMELYMCLSVWYITNKGGYILLYIYLNCEYKLGASYGVLIQQVHTAFTLGNKYHLSGCRELI